MKRAEHQPTSDLTLYAGIFVKTWAVRDAGTMLPQHSHQWPHLTLVVSGSVRVWRDHELMGDFTAPETIKIPALAKHMFQTLAGNTVLACIHASEAAEIEIAEEHQIVVEDV